MRNMMSLFDLLSQQRNNPDRDVINILFREAVQRCEGVFYEIVIEPRVPELCETQRYIIDYETIKDEASIAAEAKIQQTNPDDILQQRLMQTQILQENYDRLYKKAVERLNRLKEFYEERNFKIAFVQRQNKVEEKPLLLPQYETISDDEAECELLTELNSMPDLNEPAADSEEVKEYFRSHVKARKRIWRVHSDSDDENSSKRHCSEMHPKNFRSHTDTWSMVKASTVALNKSK